MSNQAEAARAALKANHQSIVTAAVIRLVQIKVGDEVGLRGIILRQQRGEQVHAAGVGIGAISAHSRLAGIVRTQGPMIVECMLDAASSVNGVGGTVVGSDNRSCTSEAGPWNTARTTRTDARRGRSIHRLESGNPSVLAEVVVKEANPGPDYSSLAPAGRISKTEARRKRLTIIVRRPIDQRNLQRLQRQVSGILRLGPPGRGEQTKSGVPAQPVIDGQVRREAPGILGVQPQPLHILPEAAV